MTDRTKFDDVRDAVYDFPTRIGSLLDEKGTARYGASDSIAATEIALFGGGDTGKTIVSQANLLVEHAGDHLFAVPRLIIEPAMAMAPYTCARAVLEGCSQTRWLLDHSLAPSDWLSRSLSLRFRGLDEQHKVMRTAKRTDELTQNSERISKLALDAERLGIEVRRETSGRVRGIGEKLPPATELAGSFLEADTFYRLFSAVAHGNQSLLLSLAFKVVPRNDLDGPVVEKSMNPDLVAELLLQLPVIWFARAVWTFFRYCGWADGSLIQVLESSYDAMHLGAGSRFWRIVGTY